MSRYLEPAPEYEPVETKGESRKMTREEIIGSGEIEEVVKGKVYRIRHHLGRDPKTGRYIRSPKKTVYGTKADARRALGEYRIELECGVKNPE